LSRVAIRGIWIPAVLREWRRTGAEWQRAGRRQKTHIHVKKLRRRGQTNRGIYHIENKCKRIW